MLYVFHGTDIAAAGEKARALVASLRAKKPDATYARMDGDSWDRSVLTGHLGGQGLFSSKYIVFLDRVTENDEAKDELPSLLEAIQKSENIFIVLEAKPNAELKRAIDASAEKVVECDPKAVAAKEEGFNVFALADAFGRRDPFRAWKIYREAMEGDASVESVIGMLFWKAKSSGMKDAARDLIVLYHDGHRGIHDLELATERYLLNCAKATV